MDAKPNQRSRKVHDRPTYQKLLLFPWFLLLHVWNRTLRFEFEGDGAGQFRAADKPYMVVAWHNTLFVTPLLITRLRKHREVCALVSASKDGAWLVAIFELIGFRSVRGSANFRGAQSLKELMRATRKGWDIGITPDGSQGPAYVLKPGTAAVAKACKVGLILVGVQFHRAWRLRSWDRFFIPLPFSKVTLRVDRIAAFEDLDEPDPYEASLLLQERLMRLQPVDPLIPDPARTSASELGSV